MINIKEVLKRYFGYDEFREGQEELIQAIISGRDTLGIMPTGAGKSLCYQIPALVMDGITLVVSPLISLMKDQVLALNRAGIHAAYMNSSLSPRQMQAALENAARGQYKIIYVAPERLETERFLWFVSCVKISMITIDEAHCISQWGQDFRPSYLNIIRFIQTLPERPVVSAFTATATDKVRQDIVQTLQLLNPYVMVSGFDRKNLYFEVQTPKKKDAALMAYLMAHREESGIIYCATRKNVDKVYEMMCAAGMEAARYHAGMSDEDRKTSQEDFIFDRKPVMAATNAFGMGIDKSNVRYVIHYNMPKDLESYYQEAGRGGRDGEAAECILLYSSQDVVINQLLIESGNDREAMEPEERSMMEERDMQRLRQMIGYCTTRDCLRRYILNYFGEEGEKNCENCGNCLAENETVDITATAAAMLHAVLESGQRYGMNLVISILRGRKNERLNHMGASEFEYFGAEKESSDAWLKEVFNELLHQGYLRPSQDKYAIVHVTEAGMELLGSQGTVEIRQFSKSGVPGRGMGEYLEKSGVAGTARSKKKGKTVKKGGQEELAEDDQELFEALRSLRTELARAEAVPPYIIFSDKTLIDLCVKKPDSEETMLEVHGIGETKMERYGGRFLTLIQKYRENRLV